MDKEQMISEFVQEAGLVVKGLVEAGYTEQFSRISFEIMNDFFMTFPKDKEFFALSAEPGRLKYFSFDNKILAEEWIEKLRKNGDATEYRIYPRVVAEMVGREYEFYQCCEAMCDSDQDAAEFAAKQQEIIDFLFPK